MGWVFEVCKISSQDQVLNDVPVPQMLEQLMNVHKSVSQGSVRRWTAEQSAQFPALPDMCERKRVEAVNIILQEHNLQRRVGQRIVENVEGIPCLSPYAGVAPVGDWVRALRVGVALAGE